MYFYSVCVFFYLKKIYCISMHYSLCFMTKVHALVLDKLIRGQIVDGMVVVNWLFLPTTVQDFHKYETKNGQI